MVELLGGLPGDLGPWAILGVIVLLFATGAIPTKRELRDVQADRDYWRASADKWQEVASKHGMTLERLLSLAEASEHALSEISAVVTRPEAGP